LIDFSPLPNERRNFLHKRLLGAAKTFVSSGFNPVAAAGSFVAGPPAVRRPPPRTQTARPSRFSAIGKEAGRSFKFGGSRRLVGTTGTAVSLAGVRGFGPLGGSCPPLMKVDPATGQCAFFLGTQRGPDGVELPTGAGLPVGNAVMGQFGAALMPGQKIINRAVCLRGMVVASDGLCYNKSQIKNADRMWPRGRRPLLTGGDMSAIAKAARAASRLERTTKRLQKIGLMKKPARGPSRRQIAAEVRTEIHHSK